MSRKLFGTDGVRGTVNQYPMTAEFALNLGRAIAQLFSDLARNHQRPRVVIGKDTRLSGYMLESAMVAGLNSQGADVHLVGPLPTPAIAFITTGIRADAGVVISASHNPYYDNGIKIFGGDGFKLPDEMEAKLEALLDHNLLDRGRPHPEGVGTAKRVSDPVGRYVVAIKHSFPKEMDLTGLSLVLDCANGAAYRCAPMVFEELGAKVHVIGAEPDGVNINLGVGSLHPEVCAKKVLELGADLGVALDGDADRVILVDDKGQVLNGDHIMNICARGLKKKGQLAQSSVVATVMSNMGLEIALAEAGIGLTRCPVGDRYVVEAMRRTGCNFGGEQSGHLIFLDHGSTGDGTLATLQTLAVMREEGKSLSELAKLMTTLPQVLLNVKARRTKEALTDPRIMAQVDKVDKQLEKRGRILLRPSGTEPVVRVMLEGDKLEELEMLARETADMVEQLLND